jgi:hypothetical protein
VPHLRWLNHASTWDFVFTGEAIDVDLFIYICFFLSLEEDRNVWLLLSFFQAVVMPAFMHGWEVWGTCLLPQGIHAQSDELSRMWPACFKNLLGVHNCTSSFAMLRELGEYHLLLLIVGQLPISG